MTASRTLRIGAVGDISFNGHYSTRKLGNTGVEFPFSALKPMWRDLDLLVGNLESPVATGQRAAPSKVTLRAPSRAAEALKKARFDLVSLANNHIMDYGVSGLDETLRALDAFCVPHVGCGPGEEAARKARILECRDQRVGFLAYCDVEQKSPLYAGLDSPGVAPLRVEDCCQDIARLRPRVDWLILHLHWGMEMAQLPSPEQRAMARKIIDAGADLILGHHPHVLQPMEWVKGVPVFYSLGNFLFSEMYWRGVSPSGDRFISKLRLHPLSRKTGWAEVVLSKIGPTKARFHPARFGRDLVIRQENTRFRRKEWEELNRRLDVIDYEAEFRSEAARAAERTLWRWSWRSLPRRIEAKLFHFGLIPNAVEGT